MSEADISGPGLSLAQPDKLAGDTVQTPSVSTEALRQDGLARGTAGTFDPVAEGARFAQAAPRLATDDAVSAQVRAINAANQKAFAKRGDH